MVGAQKFRKVIFFLWEGGSLKISAGWCGKCFIWKWHDAHNTNLSIALIYLMVLVLEWMLQVEVAAWWRRLGRKVSCVGCLLQETPFSLSVCRAHACYDVRNARATTTTDRLRRSRWQCLQQSWWFWDDDIVGWFLLLARSISRTHTREGRDSVVYF